MDWINLAQGSFHWWAFVKTYSNKGAEFID